MIILGIVLLAGGLGLIWWGRKEKAIEEVERPTPTLKIAEEKKGGEERVKILMVVAPKNFRDEELFETKKVLEEKGIEVEIASKGVGEAQGMLGGKTSVDRELKEVRVEDYAGVVFVGGTGASAYFDDELALSLARQADEKGKVVAAICIAPSILANAGVLEGKRATSFPSEEGNLKEKGAVYTGEGVTVDGRIVTAQGPAWARGFGQKVAEALNLP